MKARLATWIIALSASAVLALPGRVAAQHPTTPAYPYILVDLGTLGGPQSSVVGPNVQVVTNSGLVNGQADTPITDTDALTYGLDPYIQHAFTWNKGVLTDLGALPGNNSSTINWINVRGDVACTSETGATDPLAGIPASHAILCQHGRLTDLGTLGGYESGSISLNDQNQVVGFATNTIPDPYFFWGAQQRAFLWQNGHMQDLGTFGGPDAWAQAINDRGQIIGWSFTSAISNPVTGMPTMDPFLWQDGHMHDLGTLGGTMGFSTVLNNSGEVAGQSNLVGDQTYHPFLWAGHTLRDLGTLGGANGFANAINDAGDVVGRADLPGSQTHHAFLWKQGVMTDLGVPAGDNCDTASAVNAADQVVGPAGICGVGALGAFLWEQGTIYDVNTLVAPSDLHVTVTEDINDAGEIAGNGVLPTGETHAVLLIPAGLAASEGITSNAPAPGTAGPAIVAHSTPAVCGREPAWLPHLIRTYRPPTC